MIAILSAYGYQANVNCNAHVVVLKRKKVNDDKIFYNLLYINRGKCVCVCARDGERNKQIYRLRKSAKQELGEIVTLRAEIQG